MTGAVHEATADELADWDRRTVDVPGGQVLQSRAWARHRQGTGWQAHHLVLADGRAVLALRRRWPLLGGWRAYLPRGPVTAGDPPERVADRLAAVTAWLAERGTDVVTTDAELRLASGYGERLRALGFRPIEEIEPARHRLALAIEGATEAALLAGVAKPTRQRIRQAEEEGIEVRRFDRLVGVSGDAGTGLNSGSGDAGTGLNARTGLDAGTGFVAGPAAELTRALETFHGLVAATGERRGFRLGPLEPFLAWLTAAHAAGHAIYLEARSPGPEHATLAGLLLYRQGDRLSTSISGDHAGRRGEYPGVLHLLRWRAIQLAAREGRREMDLGGVDIAGARHEPRQGEPMYGLYQHKRSFGAVFVEQVGAHERALRPVHLAIARAAAGLAGRLR